MKLKYNFVIRSVGDSYVAVAVGEDAAKFNGMIKLNTTGEVIFSMLQSGAKLNDIVEAVASKFDVAASDVDADVVDYIEKLQAAELIVE